MYPGYLVLAGVEVINAERTALYVQRALPGLGFRDTWGGIDGRLHLAVNDMVTYESPMIDQAPWYDPRDVNSWNFYGLYPLEIVGAEDSTLTASVTDLVGGGSVASAAYSTGRQVMVRGILVGLNEAAVDGGMRWLSSVLHLMADGACVSSEACFFTSLPPLLEASADFITAAEDEYGNHVPQDGYDECARHYRRHWYDVSPLQGVRKVRDWTTSAGYVREVEFVIHAGSPYAFSDPVFAANARGDLGVVISEVACPPEVVAPILDPGCLPAPPPPPSAPDIANICLEAPATWTRHVLEIPQDVVPQWQHAVPVISLTTFNEEVNQVRIRFWANPFGYDITDLEECNYCGEFIVSYIPMLSDMVIDGSRNAVTVDAFGSSGPQPASHLLYGSGGGPMQWPLLDCGISYLMTVDVAPGAEMVEASVSLVVRDG